MLRIAYSPIYKYSLPEGHRFPMEKYELLPEQLLHEGTVAESNFFAPTMLCEEDLLQVHTQDYLQELKNLPMERRRERAIGFPVSENLVHRGRFIAEGTIRCVEYALRHGVAMNIAGGTHHAYADHGEGFCVFNDFALAARYHLRRGSVGQVLIVDLDVHQGNGTAHIFSHESEVFTMSIHGERNYPLRKEESDLDIGLSDGTDDALYLQTLRRALPSVIDQVEPDLILYLAGVDLLESDKLGRLSLTRAGCLERDRVVLELCHRHDIPCAISMGGGYSESIRDIIEAHANTFRVAQELYF